VKTLGTVFANERVTLLKMENKQMKKKMGTQSEIAKQITDQPEEGKGNADLPRQRLRCLYGQAFVLP